ncbi:histidine-rich glycoprotein [Struthio camelus]|uniref:histidine-rich glycoprotein n=1 Tax=Struthio camelus TaxID=8801 RepID=UPI00051E17C6|nr:PREDICTED: histidine-rich glycoprotein [Struthio camelus australis]
MQLLASALFLTLLQCSTAQNETSITPADCDTVEIEAAVALDLVNRHRRDGYVFGLLRVVGAHEQHIGYSSILYLTLDVLETKCSVLSGRRWEACEYSDTYSLVFGQCKIITYTSQLLKKKHQLYGFNCTVSPVPPDLLECNDCPIKVEVLEVTVQHKDIAAKALEKYNSEGNHTNYFNVDKVEKILQMTGSSEGHILEFSIKETNCSKSAQHTDMQLECDFLDDWHAQVGFCHATISASEESNGTDINCELYHPWQRHYGQKCRYPPLHQPHRHPHPHHRFGHRYHHKHSSPPPPRFIPEDSEHHHDFNEEHQGSHEGPPPPPHQGGEHHHHHPPHHLHLPPTQEEAHHLPPPRPDDEPHIPPPPQEEQHHPPLPPHHRPHCSHPALHHHGPHPHPPPPHHGPHCPPPPHHHGPHPHPPPPHHGPHCPPPPHHHGPHYPHRPHCPPPPHHGPHCPPPLPPHHHGPHPHPPPPHHGPHCPPPPHHHGPPYPPPPPPGHPPYPHHHYYKRHCNKTSPPGKHFPSQIIGAVYRIPVLNRQDSLTLPTANFLEFLSQSGHHFSSTGEGTPFTSSNLEKTSGNHHFPYHPSQSKSCPGKPRLHLPQILPLFPHRSMAETSPK